MRAEKFRKSSARADQFSSTQSSAFPPFKRAQGWGSRELRSQRGVGQPAKILTMTICWHLAKMTKNPPASLPMYFVPVGRPRHKPKPLQCSTGGGARLHHTRGEGKCD